MGPFECLSSHLSLCPLNTIQQLKKRAFKNDFSCTNGKCNGTVQLHKTKEQIGLTEWMIWAVTKHICFLIQLLIHLSQDFGTYTLPDEVLFAAIVCYLRSYCSVVMYCWCECLILHHQFCILFIDKIYSPTVCTLKLFLKEHLIFHKWKFTTRCCGSYEPVAV